MVNRNLYLKNYRERFLNRTFCVTWICIVDNRYFLFFILCMSVCYPVDNSVANPVDKRYKP